MTVKELIEELGKVEDKSLEVHVTEMMVGEYVTHESYEVDKYDNKVFIW